MLSKSNKKLIFGITLTFLVCLGYLVIADFMTSPEGLQYPNPGHHPGEIGPGTFNDSNNPNPYWNFPGNLTVSGKGTFNELCVGGDCYPWSGVSGGGEFDSCEIVECNALAPWGSTVFVNCSATCPSDKWLISGGAKPSVPGRDFGCGCYTTDEITIWSFPETTGLGGIWKVGGMSCNGITGQCPIKGYAFCCNFTECGGSVEDKWVNETGDTMSGDLDINAGLTVGDPIDGNKGSGTINAEAIYVDGSEISGGGGLPILGICNEKRGIQSAYCCPPSGYGSCYWRDETTCWGTLGSAVCNPTFPCDEGDSLSGSYILGLAGLGQKKCECEEGALYCIQTYIDTVGTQYSHKFGEAWQCYCLDI